MKLPTLVSNIELSHDNSVFLPLIQTSRSKMSMQIYMGDVSTRSIKSMISPKDIKKNDDFNELKLKYCGENSKIRLINQNIKQRMEE